MADDIFKGLPPPSIHLFASVEEQLSASDNQGLSPVNMPSVLPPARKSALKREKPDEPLEEVAPQKRLRFKMTVDTTDAQVIDAIKKITSHIRNPSKFNKASKLAIQLIQAGSVKPENGDHFFALLHAAMSSTASCNEPSLRADYHALFSAVQDVTQLCCCQLASSSQSSFLLKACDCNCHDPDPVKLCFSKQQNNILTTWMIRAVVANDLYTDDSFVYSKAAGKIKDAIANLPVSTTEDDAEEAETLSKAGSAKVATACDSLDAISPPSPSDSNKEASDPFGLDALLPHIGKKDEKARGKEITNLNRRVDEEEEQNRFIKAQREALLLCLEIAARRYKVPWCQTVIDILAKYAFDHINRFALQQRDAIQKLWASIKEQQIRRKQGKSVTGKLDMNTFEWLQEEYANKKISIRHSVGGGGERRAEQWLG